MAMFDYYDEHTKIMTKEEYRKFTEFVDDHFEEFYTNKWGHSIFVEGDKFFVTLTGYCDYSFEEMLA